MNGSETEKLNMEYDRCYLWLWILLPAHGIVILLLHNKRQSQISQKLSEMYCEIAHLSSYVSNLYKCLPNYDLPAEGESKFSKMCFIWPNATSVKSKWGLSIRSLGLQCCCLYLSCMSFNTWARRGTLRWNISFVCLLACLVVWNLYQHQYTIEYCCLSYLNDNICGCW